MFNLLFLWSGALACAFRSRRHLVLENLALRQQLTVLKRRRPRPRLDLFDNCSGLLRNAAHESGDRTAIPSGNGGSGTSGSEESRQVRPWQEKRTTFLPRSAADRAKPSRMPLVTD